MNLQPEPIYTCARACRCGVVGYVSRVLLERVASRHSLDIPYLYERLLLTNLPQHMTIQGLRGSFQKENGSFNHSRTWHAKAPCSWGGGVPLLAWRLPCMASAFTAAILLPGSPANSAPAAPAAPRTKVCWDMRSLNCMHPQRHQG